jgi:hypothetical protein
MSDVLKDISNQRMSIVNGSEGISEGVDDDSEEL